MLDVCLMGSGGSIPKPERHLSSALLRYCGASIVIDCGEGTQIALKKAGFTFSRIGIILITHFHADHISGLPGMLLSMGNEGRVGPVIIAGPPGLARVVESLCIIARGLPFEVVTYEFSQDGGSLPKELFSDNKREPKKVEDEKEPFYSPPSHIDPITLFDVKAFPLFHTTPCLGYRISIPRAGKFDPNKAKAAGIPVELWGKLQRGEAAGGFLPDDVLGPPRKGLDVSFVTDSRPSESISSAVFRSDLLICESMFASDKTARALKSRHMTAAEAAYIARDAEVGRLWLTHYSPSVNDTSVCLAEACEIFQNTTAGRDGTYETLRFPDQN